MENIMMLPASYCVMNEEEMTYTSGGANIVQAAAAVFIPFYGWFAIRRTGPALARML